MRIIPAIDILSGKVVRLKRGNIRAKITYPFSPLEIALCWKNQGAKRIHIIDLDAVYSEGKKRNTKIIEELRANLPEVELQVGGGIRSLEMIERLLSCGIDYVILGSILFLDREFYKRLDKLPTNRIIVAIDVDIEGKLLSRGWQKKEDVILENFLSELTKVGISSVICTDTYYDGTLLGFHNVGSIIRIKNSCPSLEIYLSGGINSIEDIVFLESFSPAGIIIGRALYENKLNLKDLILRFEE